MNEQKPILDILSLLRWQRDAGIDEILEESPSDWRAILPMASSPMNKSLTPRTISTKLAKSSARINDPSDFAPSEVDFTARHEAARATNLHDLRTLLEAFEGCPLKKTATHTVFADGNPESGLMLIGEAPGEEEDRVGKPFVGPAGQLLDRMMGAIGLDRRNFYITNVCFWRPPGNRKPSEAEWAACRPFVFRHIQLVKPKLILLLGGSATQQILGRSEGITRLRGQWHELGEVAPNLSALATFHPAYLLRQPAAKRETWRDLIQLRRKLSVIN